MSDDKVVKSLREVQTERKVTMCVPMPSCDITKMASLAEKYPNLTKTEIARMAVRYAIYNKDFLSALKEL